MTLLPCVQLTYEAAMKMLWYSVILFLFFLFRVNVKKGHLDESDLWHCCGNFSKVPS